MRIRRVKEEYDLNGQKTICVLYLKVNFENQKIEKLYDKLYSTTVRGVGVSSPKGNDTFDFVKGEHVALTKAVINAKKKIFENVQGFLNLIEISSKEFSDFEDKLIFDIKSDKEYIKSI